MSWIDKIKAAWKLTPEQIQQAEKLKAGENIELMRDELMNVFNNKGWSKGKIVKALGGNIKTRNVKFTNPF
jgi:hypothetical protein